VRVDGEEPQAIGEALARLLLNPAEVERMGCIARERVLHNFTHQRRVDQLRELALRGRYRTLHGTREAFGPPRHP